MNSLEVIKDILDHKNVSSPKFRTITYHLNQPSAENAKYAKYGTNTNEVLHDMNVRSLEALSLEIKDRDIAIDTEWEDGYIPVLDVDSANVDTAKLFRLMNWTESSICYVMESSPGKRHYYFNGIGKLKNEFFQQLRHGKGSRGIKNNIYLYNTNIVDDLWAQIYEQDNEKGGFIRVGGLRPPPKLLFTINNV